MERLCNSRRDVRSRLLFRSQELSVGCSWKGEYKASHQARHIGQQEDRPAGEDSEMDPYDRPGGVIEGDGAVEQPY